MAIQVTYKKQINDKLIKNYVLFSNESFKIYNLNQISLKKREFFMMLYNPPTMVSVKI